MTLAGQTPVRGAPAGRRGARLSAASPAGALLLVMALAYPALLSAQARQPASAAVLLARADSAFARGDSAVAALGYAAVLAVEPASSRATYQRARLLPPGSPEAVRLFRRYTELEPGDGWGFIALGQALLDAGLPGPAAGSFARAERLEPDAPEAAHGHALALAEAERTDAAIAVLERWVARSPGDASAWARLARERQRAGRIREALRALERAHALAPDAALAERAASLRALAAPALTPLVGGSRDSDGVEVVRAGLAADVGASDRVRVGIAGASVQAGDGVARARAWEGTVTAGWRPRRTLEADAALGAAGTGGDVHPVGRARLRWAAPAHGPGIELRAQRTPLYVSPALLEGSVILEEARGRVETPLAGPLRARALGTLGILSDAAHDNRRLSWGGALAARVGGASELGVVYQEMGYRDPAGAAYFAPERVRTLEAATYVEWYGAWPLVVALDAGAGAQRVTEHGSLEGGWRRALRLWALVSWTGVSGREARLEVEGYDAATGTEVAPAPDGDAAGSWRYGSARLSLRLPLGG